MKQVLLILICIASLQCFSQEMEKDIYTESYALPDSTGKSLDEFKEENPSLVYKGLQYGLHESLGLFDLKKPMFFETLRESNGIPEPGTAYIPLWKDGVLSASGSISVMPGLMKIDTGYFGLQQRIGNFSVFMGGVANKYGYFNGLHTQYGVNGNMLYQFSPKLSFAAFGTYYFGKPPVMANGMPMQPAMIEYYKVSTFGGYVSYQFNEIFGIDVGAQAVRQLGTEKYQLEPIVTPTVKLGKVKVGLPVGQILNGIVHSKVEERRNRH